MADIDAGHLPGHRRLDGGGDVCDVWLQGAPVIGTEQESGKGTPRPVLIELDPFVVGDEDLETRLLDEVQQSAVLDAVPSGLVYVRDLVAGEIPGDLARDAFVQDDAFQG